MLAQIAAVVAAIAAVVLARGRHRGTRATLALRTVGVAALVALAWVPPAPPRGALGLARGVALVADGSASMALDGRALAAQHAAARLADAVTAVTVASERGATASTLDAVATQWPTGALSSRIVPALQRALATEPPPAAVVVVTDGELTEGPADVALLPARCPPVRVVIVGERPAPDVALGQARVDPIVFAGAPARLTARVHGTGLAQGYTARVTAVDTRGVPLGAATVALPEGTSERAVAIDVALDTPGPQRIRVTVAEPDGDALPGNASADLAVTALRDRLRVLLLAGRPSFDLRALRRALRSHLNLDLVSFYILRTDDDLTMATNDELSLIPFPTDELFREHLGSFDAVFIHDLDPEPFGLDAHMPALVRYVTQGGALAIIGSTGLSAPTYRSGTLSALLPVVPSAAPPDERAFVAEPSPVADLHPITHDLISAPLALAGAARIASVAQDATTLLFHPGLTTDAGGPAPVLTLRRAGAGRVLVLTTDTIWRVGFPALATGADPERLATFWDRVLAWLAGEAGGTLGLELEGRAVRVVGGRGGEDVEVDVEQRAGGHALRRLTLDATGAGTLRVDAEIASARVRSPATSEERTAYTAGPEAGDERAGVARDDRVLRALVARCGGAIVRGDAGDVRTADVERAAVARGMARPRAAALLALVALTALGLEWLIRRTRGAR